MRLENAGGRKLPKLMTHHVFGDIDIGEYLAAMDQEGEPHEIGSDHGASAPGLNGLLITLLDGSIDLGQKLLVDERSFF